MSTKSAAGRIGRLLLTLLCSASVLVLLAFVLPSPACPVPGGTVPASLAIPSFTDVPVPSFTDLDLSAPEADVPDTATLMFAGDFLVHKTVFSRAATGEKTYDFTPYVSLFEDVFIADYNSLNLENPVDAYGGNLNVSSYPKFNAPHEVLDAVKAMNIQLCTTSNNHMIDQGYDGMLNSLSNVRQHGFDTLGTYMDQDEHDSLFIKEINGIKVGFAAFTQTTNMLRLTSEQESFAFDRMGVDADEAVADVMPRITALRDAGAEIVIAVFHWGYEYNSYPSFDQTEIARKLCEGGVDVIIGSHPHVVQPVKKLTVTDADGTERSCLVAYSLGNFFCLQATADDRTRQGMVLALRLERDESGRAILADSFYMPTVTYCTYGSGGDFMRIVPAGKYLDGLNIPEPLNSEDFVYNAKLAWNAVTDTVGSDIPFVTDPEHYPEGFFD